MNRQRNHKASHRNECYRKHEKQSTDPTDKAQEHCLEKKLKKDKVALKEFEEFSPSNKKEYVMWIIEAKTEATRAKRMEQAMEWIAEGKPRLWKYMKK